MQCVGNAVNHIEKIMVALKLFLVRWKIMVDHHGFLVLADNPNTLIKKKNLFFDIACVGNAMHHVEKTMVTLMLFSGAMENHDRSPWFLVPRCQSKHIY